MGAPKGNKFWEIRSKHGRKKLFETPESLWEAACKYFEWVEDHPLEKAIIYQGEVTGQESLMRAMTLDGLTLFLGVNVGYLNDFERGLDPDQEISKDFSIVINRIKQVIREQKFTGAAAGLLNPNIIARDLGLADKQDYTSSDGTMSPERKGIKAFYEDVQAESKP